MTNLHSLASPSPVRASSTPYETGSHTAPFAGEADFVRLNVGGQKREPSRAAMLRCGGRLAEIAEGRNLGPLDSKGRVRLDADATTFRIIEFFGRCGRLPRELSWLEREILNEQVEVLGLEPLRAALAGSPRAPTSGAGMPTMVKLDAGPNAGGARGVSTTPVATLAPKRQATPLVRAATTLAAHQPPALTLTPGLDAGAYLPAPYPILIHMVTPN